MSGPIDLYINHVLISRMEWSMSAEEVLGGTGRCTIRVQDRNNSYEPKCHWDVKAVIASSGFVLFRGEIINEPEELPVGMPWRVWALDCADYNNELPQRLVGAFDGRTWEDADGLGVYVNVDHYANSLKTDKKTVKRLLDHYIRVDGEALETDTYVFKYLDDFATIYWAYTDLQSALEDLASQIVENLQFWIDPDLKFHWQTIPEWQELLQDTLAIAADDTLSQLAGMMPEGMQDLDFAPFYISDDPDDTSPDKIGGRDLKFNFDGSNMPQQIYVRGSTGFVYNAGKINPAGDTKVINPEGYGYKASEKYQITFNETTKIWSRDDDGYIELAFDTIAASGPFDVVFIQVPWNEARHKGGHFWKMTSGPKKGWLVDNDTNYFGYGDITVERLIATKTDPKIGVGGSGWVKDVVQDPNKRQAYLEAPISSSQKIRDAVGGQALYRAKFPTLRGSITVGSPDETADGWRVGQVVKIIDARLPDALNGRYFVIQRVQAKLISGTDVREYTLDWGDGPTSRWSMHAKMKPIGKLPPPATQIIIHAFDLSPGPNSEQVITGQLANHAGGPWHIAGKVVKWTLEAYTSAGVRTTGGSLHPKVSITDQHGRARTTLKTGPEAGRVYFVFADVAAN